MAARAGYNQTGKRNFRSVPCSDRLYSVSYIYTVIPSIILFFNIPVTIHSPDKVTRQCPQTANSEVKGEPKQIRTEVPLLTSLMPYRRAKPAHTGFQTAVGAPGRTKRFYNVDRLLSSLFHWRASFDLSPDGQPQTLFEA